MELSKHKEAIAFGIIFLIIASLLLYSSFTGDKGFTGNLIKQNQEQTISIKTDLETPTIELDDTFEKVQISKISDNYIEIENQQFNLEKNQADILLENFDGKLTLDKSNILLMEGKTDSASVNNIPITSKLKSKLGVKLGERATYEEITLKGISISSLTYTTTGSIQINEGKTIINLDNEQAQIQNFHGDLTISKGKFILDGTLESLKVNGESVISIG